MHFNTRINLIKIPRYFNHSIPDENKMNDCRDFYRKYHRIDRDIVVDEDMVLQDGYIGYLILIENGVEYLSVNQIESRKVIIVYGVHPGVEKEYRWKIVDETEDKCNLKVGSHAIVRTSFGDTEVTITKIYTVSKKILKNMGHVKRVVKCLPE